jgi:multiple antibiotic resistance protein
VNDFILCFVPLFVAVDAVGTLPLFIGLTRGLPRRAMRKVIVDSVLTATGVAVLFLFGGRELLRLMGITIADFMVAGGLLIFVIALSDVITSEKSEKEVDRHNPGAVPLGVPLIAGPAVLTTSILLLDTYGALPTAAALVLNILIAGAVFTFGDGLNRLLGSAGARIISKIANLLLAAIAVMMIRKGVVMLLTGSA